MTESMNAFGPVQVLAVAFDDPAFDGSVVAELSSLQERGLVRVLDAALVVKQESGALLTVDADDMLDVDRAQIGSVVGALVGLGAGGAEGVAAGAVAGADPEYDMVSSEDMLHLAEILGPGDAAAVIVIEHAFARDLMRAIRASGGTVLSDDLIHAEDLIELGVDLAAAASPPPQG